MLRGWAGADPATRIGLGEVDGTIAAAASQALMPFYRSMGDVPRKRHTFHHDADGRRFAEELVGQAGFSSASALLYHPLPLTAIEPVTGRRSTPP